MKIFVTVGTQLPFDRMVSAIDRWAGDNPDHDVFAQVGPAEYEPAHVRWQDFVDPETFKREYEAADLVVGHAGTGTVFTALQAGKPVIIMPRSAALGEHRNEHQRATAAHFCKIPGVHLANDEHELTRLLDDIDAITGPEANFSPHAQPRLLRALSDFVNETPVQRIRGRLWRTIRGVR